MRLHARTDATYDFDCLIELCFRHTVGECNASNAMRSVGLGLFERDEVDTIR